MLAYTLSKFSKISFDSLLTRKIFLKYDMTNTTINKKEIINTLVQGPDAQGNPTPNWAFSVLTGAGGYSSSMIIDTKTKNGIILLSNLSTFNTHNKNIDNLSLF